ncbi:Asp-tRNA(Asn)/Glu-tRNA(Gln) amidotransferase subunit GatB [Flammeovirga kamogawensis]|uniref:Aspartyl/glutamyl-tRNA(Asn/Gln) amidotransferase subunit B n=1 Tax=Flammeovirga kamogawensis TaxID=373891 RepID=A0ABX8GU25_9BACT|nr:Asp-tRNA(Asn)/Glu-tRNA(Gln) amidotransferase subunit GatB [Flammeovirga kamogawensis]MBB6462516.1 aspartyl-tRNA(Asn)/glutamyl-tRNA(Gln) amidotransferase subunit B [Flammeovirga kamogawensis]QWG06747.1 Asp-tRNA(Asn)/Glu-tRNA(Gln) amidotransferase subunit GatB [Flammeovirga kamogawensis]TRX68570.1 Asp-tRNA(Asn)/Glu-tRNA(Gln) amidotransferase subunit GatB [Flammeovirga kamogawensis]
MDKTILDKYELVIGLEVHSQLQTKSKIFASDPTTYGQDPNVNISAITLALPGTLPKVNKSVLEYSIKMGLACNCSISEYQFFDRKNYFYPDLPKGYQTTQDKTPICVGGHVDVVSKKGDEFRVILNRIHMEEDAGKSTHLDGAPDTLVDLNRAGVPLMEIVTEPCIHDSAVAAAFVGEIRKIVRYLDISDGNMEEGSLRCDANVSVRLKGETKLGEKCEIKNMNSMRNIQKAIDYEMKRQIKLIEAGEPILSETRTFNVDTGKTYGMRSKETLNDYRYFPCPDLPPMIVKQEWVDKLKAEMPSLPAELIKKFISDYKLPEYDAEQLTESKETAMYFEALCNDTKNYKVASNWMMGPLKSLLNETGGTFETLTVRPNQVADTIALVDDKKISNAAATQQLLKALSEKEGVSAEELAKELDLIQDSGDDFLVPLIQQAIDKFPDKAAAYKKGKKNLIGLFMGEVMKLAKGKADPQKTNQLLREALEK